MSDQSSGAPADKISAEIAALASHGTKVLKARWRELYDTEPPPRISRELLTRAIAYRLQEKVFGGLAPTTRRLLERVAADLSSNHARVSQARKAAPGTFADPRVAGRGLSGHGAQRWDRLSGQTLRLAVRGRTSDHRNTLVGTLVLWPPEAR